MLFTNDVIEAAFAQAGFKARQVGKLDVFLWQEKDTIRVLAVENILAYVQDNYSANNMTGHFEYMQNPADGATEIVLRFVPETKEEAQAAFDSDELNLDNLSFDIDESRIAQMQEGGMDVPEDGADCEGCKI